MTALRRARVLGIAGETTEGTFNTPSTATTPGTTSSIVIFDPVIKFKPDKFRREPARENLSPLAPIMGIQRAEVNFKTMVMGPDDVAGGLGIPEVDMLLRGCAMKRLDTDVGATGLINTRAYKPTTRMKPHYTAALTAGATAGAGATITVGSTTGLVAGDTGTINGASLAREEQVTVLAITGATTFTVVTLSGNKNSGDVFVRNSAAIPLSIEIQGQEKSYRMRGARGNWKLMAKVGEAAMFDFTFQGAIQTVTDTFTAFTPTYGSKVPPAFFQGNLSLGSGPYTGAHGTTFEIGSDNVLGPRESFNAAGGLVSTLITGRAPKGKFDPESVTEATYSYWANLLAGTAQALSVRVGSTSKNRMTITSPAIVLETLDDEERVGNECNGAAFECVTLGSGDDEIVLTYD